MRAVGENIQKGHRDLAQLYQSAEANLALANHAKKWHWEEVAVKPTE